MASAAATAAPAAAEEKPMTWSDQVSRYKDAAAVAHTTLNGVLAQLAAGKDVVELCEFGDTLIESLVSKMYKGKKAEKGIAFPTCVSVNQCVGHFAPLKGEGLVLKDGDNVKM
jgi:methionine aminopeptidase